MLRNDRVKMRTRKTGLLKDYCKQNGTNQRGVLLSPHVSNEAVGWVAYKWQTFKRKNGFQIRTPEPKIADFGFPAQQG